MPSSGFVCPQCGGAVKATEETGFTRCGFCGSSVYLDPALAVRHEMLVPVLAEQDLRSRLLGWFSEREVRGRPKVTSARLVFLPFWVLPAAREPVAATPLLALATEAFRLPGGDARAFDPALAAGDVVPATILLDALIPSGEDAPAGTRLVHLPFWDVSFLVHRHEHRALIDAVAGQVLAFSLPPSSEWWLDAAYAAILVVLFVTVTRALRWVLTTTPPFSSLGMGAGVVDRLVWSPLGIPRYAGVQLVLAGPAAWLVVRAAGWARWKLGERG